LLQNETPHPEEYLPVRQSVHGKPAASDNLPAGHSQQLERLFEPGDDDFPTAQLTQVLDKTAPIAVENVPALHSVQTVAPLTGT
jgi:hypothetical protein